MLSRFAQNFYSAGRASYKNTEAFIIDQLTNTKSVREPVIADNPEEAEKIAALVVAGNATGKILYGAGYMIYGIFLGILPEKKRVHEITREGFVDETNPDAEVKYVTAITKSDTLPKSAVAIDQSKSGVFSFAYAGETRAIATGEVLRTEQVNEPRWVKRPFIPGIDTAPETMDHTTRQKKVAETKATAVLGGYSYFRAGLGTALSGVADAAVGGATLLYAGGQKITEAVRNARS